MRMKGQLAAVVLGCAVVTGVGVADEALARGGRVTHTDVRARLQPCCSEPLVDGHGKVKHVVRLRDGEVTRERLQAKAVFGLGDLGLDETSAPLADVRAIFSRDGAPYAECVLDFDGFEAEDEGDDQELEANYKLDVEKRVDRGLRQRKGTCDVDLATADAQVGVPAVQAGDVISIVVTVGTETDKQLLQGTAFKKK